MASRKTKNLYKKVAIQKAYRKYYNDMRAKNLQPMTYYRWKELAKTNPAYFKGIAQKGTAYAPREIRKKAGLPD